MKNLLSVLLAIVLFASAFCGCSYEAPLTPEEQNDLLAGNHDDDSDGVLTILLCGPGASDVDIAVHKFEELYQQDVKVVKYKDGEWDEFSHKVLAGDSDFDLFMPVQAQIASIIRNEAYQDLSGIEDIATRIANNPAAKAVSDINGTVIAVPTFIQFSEGTLISYMMYCYNNFNLFEIEYRDPDGEELFEALKYQYLHSADSEQSSYYDFSYNTAHPNYLFMNRNSQNKELAEKFLVTLFDVKSKAIESNEYFTYPEIDGNVEYVPSWLYWSYDIVEPIGEAFRTVLETDGSDEAIRRIAEEASKAAKMRMEG